jgi:hypothetical protein
MADISSLAGVTRADLAAFNRCHLFLGVHFLSEITAADGISLARDAWTGNRARFSYLLWPFQPKPGPRSWQLWRRLLARAFLDTPPQKCTPKTKDLTMLHPLGAWLARASWIFRKWTYHFSPSTGKIYSTGPTHYNVHQRQRRSRHRSQLFSATPIDNTTSLPTDCVPVEELSASGTLLAFRVFDTPFSPRGPHRKRPLPSKNTSRHCPSGTDASFKKLP